MRSFVSVALLTITAAAKDKLQLVEDGILRNEPKVELFPCYLCAVNSDWAKACLGYHASFSLGWQWIQKFYDNTSTPNIIDGYYDLKFKLFSENSVGLELLTFLSNIVNLDVIGQFKPFKTGGYFSYTYYTVSRRSCFNLAYTIDDLNFETVMNLQLGQCYKDIIACIYNFDNWTGKDAKFFQ